MTDTSAHTAAGTSIAAAAVGFMPELDIYIHYGADMVALLSGALAILYYIKQLKRPL
jgi:hypothetical protein